MIGEKEGFANTLLNIGTVYTTMERYHVATRYYERALNVFEELGYATAVEQTLQSMAENFLAEGKEGRLYRPPKKPWRYAKAMISRKICHTFIFSCPIFLQQKIGTRSL